MQAFQRGTAMDNEGIAHEIIEETLPIAPTFGAYRELLKAMTKALDEAESRGRNKQTQENMNAVHPLPEDF